AAFPKRMEVKPEHRKVVVYLLAVLIALFGVLIYEYRPHETHQCGPTISEYRNSRYGYQINAPAGWRLATNITLVTNIGIPIQDAEYVYFTRLSCRDELRISAAVPQGTPFSGGPAVTEALKSGNVFILFANVSDGGLEFAQSASKMRLHDGTALVQDITSEVLNSGLGAVTYRLR